MKKLKISKAEILNIFEWLAIFFVAFYMISYGIAKPLQFGNISDYTKPIHEMEPMRIMWAFYAYSKPFVIIIGVFEVLGSVLLIIPKTRLIGCILLTFILINIILQDVFFKVHVGALANAVLFQILILGIFIIHRSKIFAAFRSLKCSFKFKFRFIYLLFGLGFLISFQLLFSLINKLLSVLN